MEPVLQEAERAEPEFSLGEFVRYLMLLMHRNEVPLALGNHQPWHLAFYRLKRYNIRGRPRFFGELIFSWEYSHPRFDELAQFLNSLGVTSSVIAVSPHIEEYSLTPEMVKLCTGNFEALEQETRGFLNIALAIIKDEFQKFGLLPLR